MAKRPLLVVLIVRDAGLRSALAVRLATDHDLLTALVRGEALIERRMLQAPATLVIDEESAAGAEGDWIKAKAAEGLFSRVIVLTLDGPDSTLDIDGLIQINQSSAIAEISQLVAA